MSNINNQYKLYIIIILYIYYYDDILSMSDNIILTDRHNGLVICTIPLVPLYRDMNGYVAIFIKIALSQN